MNPKLPTAEHILAKIVENKFKARIGVCKFNDKGLMEVHSGKDLREENIQTLENQANEIISKNLPIKKYLLPRQEADKLVDLHRVPDKIKEIRIVEISGFDRRACKDPHVDNTSEIGRIRIEEVKRVGKDRYRFIFHVE